MVQSSQSRNEKVIVFQLKDESYGVPVDQVLSIERLVTITRVPGTPDFMKGVINLRGVITPIIDLRLRLGFDQVEATDNTRVIIVHVEEMEVGLIVDAANDVIDIEMDQIEATPEITDQVRDDYIRGVAKLRDRLLVLLNLNHILSKKEVSELKSLEV